MNPIQIAAKIEESLRAQAEYLRPLHKHEALFDLGKYSFCKDMYLERIPFYAPSQYSLNQLAEKGVIEEETAKAFGLFFDCGPEKFCPYQHQENAIRSVKRGENLIVCTGTGSGKTESFLIPVINSIISERKAAAKPGGVYSKGIRALILYPMNALVNDQVARIRKIVRGAEKNNIEYAREITYGIYTGDLEEKNEKKENIGKISKEFFDDNHKATHNFLSPDEIPSTEYTSREQWSAGECADIIITNYSMLEQLLLDPKKSFMFNSDTWRFIVLDEAHCYDGGLGTDIAWLVRRLVERCGVNGIIGNEYKKPNIQFIATSATLLEDRTIADPVDEIQRNFAAKIFPAEPKSFSVQLGHIAELSDELLKKDISYNYSQVIESPVSEIIDDYTSQIDSIFNKYSEDSIYRGMRNLCLPSQDSESHTLIELTRWYISMEGWLKKTLGNLLNLADDKIANLDESKRQPLGDVIHLAECMSSIDPKLMLDLKTESLKPLQDCYIQMEENCSERIVELINSFAVGNKGKEINERLLRWCEDQEPIFVEDFVAFINVMCVLSDINDDSAVPEGCQMCNLLVEWNSTDVLRDLRDCFKLVKIQLSEANTALKCRLLKEWRERLKIYDGNCKTIEEVVTTAMLRSVELGQLNQVWSIPEIKNNPTLSQIAENVIQDNRENKEKELAALSQLLTLTKYGHKPLMDLRFHLMISGISAAAVYFSEDERGKIIPHFVFDDDDQYEREYYEDKAKKKYKLFTLGMCNSCGHPYIMVYEWGSGSDRRYTMRYENDESKDELSYVAYSWTRGDHARQMADEEVPDNNGEQVWLNYESGEIVRTQNKPEPGNTYIPLYYQSITKDDENTETGSRISTYINTCAACGAERANLYKTDYGIVSPYKTGAAKDRNMIMTTLVKHADASVNSKGVIAQGRKLLAFSDSRIGAANLARNLDADIEELLMKKLVLDVARESDDVSSIVELDDIYERMRGGQDDETRSLSILNNRNLINILGKKDRSDFKEEMGAKLDELMYRHSLALFVAPMLEKLDQCDANSLTDKEYKVYIDDDENDEDRSKNTASWKNWEIKKYSIFAGVSMLALGTLRSNREKGLVKSGQINVRSRIKEKVIRAPKNCDRSIEKLWKRYCEAWKKTSSSNVDSAASDFFDAVYKTIFLTAYINCEKYDNKEGYLYNKETDRLVNGYASGVWTKKFFYSLNGSKDKKKDEKKSIRKMVGSGKYHTKIQKILCKQYHVDDNKLMDEIISAMWVFMREAKILLPISEEKKEYARYRLNINDVYYELDKNWNDTEDPQQVDQYYRVEEHTAQLSTQKARIIQNLFSQGKINVLSCSTTFEMGVDLGDLNCVFMANMPPSVANYKQRAGRAGRRAGSASFVVTYLGESSHDFYYRDKPQELIFGHVNMPKVYSRNEGYRAKHFRAEALAHLLQYVTSKYSNVKWGTCEKFFKENESKSPINLLPQWVNENRQVLQKYCEHINQDIIRSGSQSYSVADDLLWQLIGDNTSQFARNNALCLELSGPHLNDPWNVPLLERYRNTIAVASRVSERNAKKTRETMAKDYLAQNRVIPRYGFPCDIIKLIPAKSEIYDDIDLNRDVRQGLFEYAPGREVTVSKRSYCSDYPVSYVRGLDENRNPRTDEALHIEPICECTNHPGTYFPEGSKCPICSAKGQVRRACVPDAFMAKTSSKARSFSPGRRLPKIVTYPGSIGRDSSEIGNCEVFSSNLRTLWYINNQSFEPEDDTNEEDGEGSDKKRRYKPAEKTEQYDLLKREVRTDVLLLTHKSEKELENVTAAAWQSVLSALLRATALVLRISERDIEGLITRIGNKRYIVIYDNTPSGSGALLDMIPNETPNHNKSVSDITYRVLCEAIKLCRTCSCWKDSDIWSSSHMDFIQRQGKGGREARSCYHCLRTYANQSKHSELDAHDAWRVLTWLLGDAVRSECTDHTPESEMPSVSVPDVESVQKGELETNDAGRETVSGVEEKGRCMPPPTQLSPQDIKNIRFNNGVKGNRYLVWSDGKEIEVECRICMGNGIVSVLQGDRLLEVPVSQFIKKI